MDTQGTTDGEDPRLPRECVDWLGHSERGPGEPDATDLIAAALGDPEVSAQFARSDVDEGPASTPSAGHASLPTGSLPLAHLDALDTLDARDGGHRHGRGLALTGLSNGRGLVDGR